jgi:hypothetical protein
LGFWKQKQIFCSKKISFVLGKLRADFLFKENQLCVGKEQIFCSKKISLLVKSIMSGISEKEIV